VLGRSLEPLVVRIHMCKNRYGAVPILVFMFGGCSERWLDDSLQRIVQQSLCVALSSRKASQSSGVIGRSWCLEEVWNHL
jgi:hypothetical protein